MNDVLTVARTMCENAPLSIYQAKKSINIATQVDLFNGFVSTSWYGQDLVPDVSLQTVLNNPPIYSGAPNQGTGVACALNAFNATGAALTNGLPGYAFDCAAMALNNESDTCPIDHFGNFK